MPMTTKVCIYGGKCRDCGRCDALGLDPRKERMTLLPEGFLDGLPKSPGSGFGLAFDIGTTTVVGMLWDMSENRLLGVRSRQNPQSAFGQDVISRITHTIEEPDGLAALRELIVGCLNEITAELTPGIPRGELRRAVCVGNTTMCHLLLGVDPRSLARAPYLPAYTGPVTRSAGEMGLRLAEDAAVRVLPNIAGHVGADITAGLLAEGLAERPGVWLSVDIGTNGEMVLSSDGALSACSTAAGPAFEGASIRCGMRASPGAIERVRMDSCGVYCDTISGAKAAGVCGSGLIDVVARLLEQGVINFRGRMLKPQEALDALPPALAERVSLGADGKPQFKLTEDIYICQDDIREVQLAKGAMLAGAELLLKGAGKTASDLAGIVLAGAFGSYIDIKSALRIGLFPDVPAGKVESAGNAAGAGACMALLSETELLRANSIPERTEHLNLSAHPDFEHCYMRSMYFPK